MAVEVVEKGRDVTAIRFEVRVVEETTTTTHEVTVKLKDMARLARKEETPTGFVKRVFEFLLAREPKESIMRRFDISVISTYFPEFEQAMK